MTDKPKPPGHPAPKPTTRHGNPAPANPLRQADARWQRTVRYGWDKGGSKGGR